MEMRKPKKGKKEGNPVNHCEKIWFGEKIIKDKAPKKLGFQSLLQPIW